MEILAMLCPIKDNYYYIDKSNIIEKVQSYIIADTASFFIAVKL